MNKKELKNAIREEAAARLENTDEEYRSSASAAIAVNVLALPEMKKARSVMLYVFRDAQCSRLGHGAGYYDRFLQTLDG